MNPGNI